MTSLRLEVPSHQQGLLGFRVQGGLPVQAKRAMVHVHALPCCSESLHPKPQKPGRPRVQGLG